MPSNPFSQNFTVPSTQHTYHYTFASPTNPTLPFLVFFHGFPFTAELWTAQTTYFASRGYGILAPDMLGYGSSSAPADPSEYALKILVNDAVALLEHLGIERFHGVAHDFGVHLMSRLYNYHPEMFLSATFVSVPYQSPDRYFDVDAANAMTKKILGVEKFAYMKFLAKEGSHELLDAHVRTLTHGERSSWV